MGPYMINVKLSKTDRGYKNDNYTENLHEWLWIHILQLNLRYFDISLGQCTLIIMVRTSLEEPYTSSSDSYIFHAVLKIQIAWHNEHRRTSTKLIYHVT